MSGNEKQPHEDPLNGSGKSGPTRREVVRQGIKLAFIAPVISTFFAKSAYAARYSCYPVGHVCGGGAQESCCGTPCPGPGNSPGICPP